MRSNMSATRSGCGGACAGAAAAGFNDVLQLANVSRPVIGLQRRQRLGRRLHRPYVVVLRVHLEEVLHQHRHVLTPIAQRRHHDVDDVEPVIQILAELIRGDAIQEPAVGRCHDPHVDACARAIAADALNLARFKEAQQQRLHAQAHLAHFVHENRAAIGLLEPAALVAVGIGEAAAHVAEQLGFEQRVRHAGAIDRDQRSVPSRAAVMNHLPRDFLPHPALSRDQHLRV
jgi:hypothetical protein